MKARLKKTGEWIDVYKEGSVISKNGVEGCYYRFGDAAKRVIYGSEIVFEKYNDNESKELLYAVEKTAERTKREVIEKAAEWLRNNMFHSINDGVQINGTCVSDFVGKFKQAMEEQGCPLSNLSWQ